MWCQEDALVVDVTYGKGLFWSEYRPQNLIAHDLYVGDGVDFRNLPELDESVDVVVLDPPYTSIGGRQTSGVNDFNTRYGLIEAPATPKDLDEMIFAGMREARRVLNPGGLLWLKCGDYVSSGKFHQGRHILVSESMRIGFEQVDEFVHHSGTGPQPKMNQDGTSRRQVHSRRAHSFLCIFRKI